MSTQKAKFALFNRLQELGFTYEEAVSLRRIEMTLSRWSEAECNSDIERDEETGKPERVSRAYINGLSAKRHAWPIADREAGALKRLKAIVEARNARLRLSDTADDFLHFYHQTDPRGCSLYLVRHGALRATENMVVRKAIEFGMSAPVKANQTMSGRTLYETATFPGIVDDVPEGLARRFLREKGVAIPKRETLPINQYYNRGLAVCC